MKDSKKYSAAIQKLYRSLKRKYPKAKKVEYDNITESLVHGAVLEYINESTLRSAFKKFDDYFVDFNDMRVSRPEEIVEMLGEDGETARKAGVNVIRMLTSIFRKYNNVSLDSLKKVGKRQSRVILEKFDGMSSFSVDYCMLTALQGHAIPLTGKMIQYLRDNDLIHPAAERSDIEGFLTRQISASNAYEFYALLRRESESKRSTGGKKKTATKAGSSETKTKKKTKKTKRKAKK
jgi:hypothetical protein